MSELKWTEAQNNTVRDLIAEEIEKARLTHKFIPEMKLDEEARSVSADEFDSKTNKVDDVKTIALVEVAAAVNLTKLQAEDDDLSQCPSMIRRAANRLARAHDAIVFAGQPGADKLPPKAPPVVTAIGGRQNDGVSATPNGEDVGPPTKGESYGELLVGAVAAALVRLETAGYIGSYVLVLGRTSSPTRTPPHGVLSSCPTDRLGPLLGGGPIHRSSVLDNDLGLLISLGGEPMDRAVAVAPRFEFLRIGTNDMRECRVFERFALRLKEKDSVIKLEKK